MAVPPGQDGDHHAYCRLCEATCGLIATVKDGWIANIAPDRAHPVSEGHICIKGTRMADVTYDGDRVLRPLRRVGGPGEFIEVEWEDALADIADRLGSILAQHGADAAGCYVGNPASFATMHLAYALGFLKTLGGGKTFGALHVDTAAKNVGCEFVYGNPFRFTFPDLEECDFLIIIGGNPMVSHMSLITEPRAHRKLEEIAARGGVVVVDPRRTETARRFEHMPVLPDRDVWLLCGMVNTLFEEDLADTGLLEERVLGWRELGTALRAIPIDLCSARSGVPADDIRALARRFALARTAACYGRVGTNRGSFSTLANVLMEALNLLCGRFGEAGGWIIGDSPFGDALAKGIEPYGARRSRIGDLPLVMGFTPGNTLAAEILTPGEGQLRALFLDSGNPVVSYPRGDQLGEALDAIDLFVSLDLYMTESNRFADYILPTTTFLERADINDLWCANAPRPFLHYVDAVIPPRGEARVEFEIYDSLLERLGLPGVFAALGEGRPTHLEAADALLRMGPLGDGFGARPEGLSIERLARDHPSGLRYKQRADAALSWQLVSHPDGKPRLWNDVIAAEIDRLRRGAGDAAPGQLALFGRRRLKSMNSWMHNSERLTRNEKPTLLIHPDDARARAIADGDLVSVASAHNMLDVQAEISDEVMPGSVCYPHGWGHSGGWRHANALPGDNINMLASDDPMDQEQISGACFLDGIAVTVAPVPESRDSKRVAHQMSD